MTLHQGERSDLAFRATNWSFQGGAVYAAKTWNRQGSDPVGVYENTTALAPPGALLGEAGRRGRSLA
jgi:hypothetical protein